LSWSQCGGFVETKAQDPPIHIGYNNNSNTTNVASFINNVSSYAPSSTPLSFNDSVVDAENYNTVMHPSHHQSTALSFPLSPNPLWALLPSSPTATTLPLAATGDDVDAYPSPMPTINDNDDEPSMNASFSSLSQASTNTSFASSLMEPMIVPNSEISVLSIRSSATVCYSICC
jgi:hypothetical protein